MSLRNEGDLRLEHAVRLAVTCSREGWVIEDCGKEMSVSLPDGYGPATDTLTLRIPTGNVSLTFTYGDDVAQGLDTNLQERILGVDRDVWECFSDTSNVNTIREDNEGIGCASWSHETVWKLGQDSPVRVRLNGPDSFIAGFKDVLVICRP